MKKKIISACVLGCFVLGASVFAADDTDLSALPQVYRNAQLITLDKQNVAKGNGTLYGKFSLRAIRPRRNRLLRRSAG